MNDGLARLHWFKWWGDEALRTNKRFNIGDLQIRGDSRRQFCQGSILFALECQFITLPSTLSKVTICLLMVSKFSYLTGDAIARSSWYYHYHLVLPLGTMKNHLCNFSFPIAWHIVQCQDGNSYLWIIPFTSDILAITSCITFKFTFLFREINILLVALISQILQNPHACTGKCAMGDHNRKLFRGRQWWTTST